MDARATVEAQVLEIQPPEPAQDGPAVPLLLRVERGHAEPEELAALAVVLLARRSRAAAAYGEPGSGVPRVTALWRRPERAAGFDGPRTWRRAA